MEEEVPQHYPITKYNSNKCWRVVISIITTTIFCVIIFQSYQIEQIKSTLQRKENSKSSNFTALSLIGNGQVVRGARYLPIRGWKVEYQ